MSARTNKRASPTLTTASEVSTSVDIPADKIFIEGRIDRSDGSVISQDQEIKNDKCVPFILGFERIMTAVTTVVEGDDSRLPPSTLISARYLMSIFFMDRVAWAVAKMFHFDTVKLGEELAIGAVFLNLVLNVTETCVEFLAAFITPFIYRCTQRGKPLNARGLANFALIIFCISNTIAAIGYPILGMYVWGTDNKTMGSLILMTCARTIQYSLMNQIGDSSLEMSRPHWLKTFTGLSFITPGCDCKGALRVKSNPDTISAHITFITLIWQPILFIPYFLTYKKDTLRIACTTFLALLNIIISFSYISRMQFVSAGIVNEVVEDESESSGSIIPIWKLKGYEIAILVLVVCIRAVLTQAFSSIRVMAMLSLPSLLQAGFAVAAPVGAFLYLYWKVRKEKQKAMGRATNKNRQKYPAGSAKNVPYHERLRLWVALIFLIAISLGISSLFLLHDSGSATVAAVLASIAVLPSVLGQQMFDIEYDAFLLEYEKEHHDEVTSMQYYVGVLAMLINGPLLAANFATLSNIKNPEEETTIQYQAAIVLITALMIFLFLGIYYGVIDRCIVPKRMSIFKTFASDSQQLRNDEKKHSKRVIGI